MTTFSPRKTEPFASISISTFLVMFMWTFTTGPVGVSIVFSTRVNGPKARKMISPFIVKPLSGAVELWLFAASFGGSGFLGATGGLPAQGNFVAGAGET